MQDSGSFKVLEWKVNVSELEKSKDGNGDGGSV